MLSLRDVRVSAAALRAVRAVPMSVLDSALLFQESIKMNETTPTRLHDADSTPRANERTGRRHPGLRRLGVFLKAGRSSYCYL